MPEGPRPRFACPECGKAYYFNERVAAKKITCRGCGGKFIAPDEPDGQPLALGPDAPPELLEDDQPPPTRPSRHNPKRSAPRRSGRSGTGGDGQRSQRSEAEAYTPHRLSEGYDLDAEPDRPSKEQQSKVDHGGRCPACNMTLKSDAVICLNCGYDAARGEYLQTAINSESQAADTATDEASGADDEQGPINLDAEAQPADQAGSSLSSAYASALSAGLDQEALAAETQRRQFISNTVIPIALVLASFALTGLNAFVLGPPAYETLSGQVPMGTITTGMQYAVYLLLVGAVQYVAEVIGLAVGIMVTTAIFNSGFNLTITNLVKLLAIVLVAGSVQITVDTAMDILGATEFSFGVSIPVSFGLFWCLCAWLLEMDAVEVMITYMIALIGPYYLAIVIIAMFYA